MDTILFRQRLIVGASLAALLVLSWLYLFHSRASMLDAGSMNMSGMDAANMPGMLMPGTANWNLLTALLVFAMWAVMMVAMMVPSASPMVFAFLTVNHRRKTSGQRLAHVGIFITGYLVIWTAYSAFATLAQWGLQRAALLSPNMATTSPKLNGAVLIASGIFQWSPLKRSCLDGCRSPLSFLMSEWREGAVGAFVMGLRHGGYCVGCCWILMALLFVVGVMNLFWVVAIAFFVLAEKLFPKGELVALAGGLAMAIVGAALILRSW